MTRAARGKRRRLAASAVACAALYAATVVVLGRDHGAHEETFRSASRAGAPLMMYIDVLGFEPARQSLAVRIDVATRSALHGAGYGGPLGRDVVLTVDDGDSEQTVTIGRAGMTGGALLSLDVSGAIATYPFDRYRGAYMLRARARTARGTFAPVPLAATVWEDIPGWRTESSASPATNADALTLGLTLRRTAPIVAFALVLYALMVVVAIGSACIGGLIFVGARKVESTVIGALAAMVFSLVALRNVLPGTPPIGIAADGAIFLWAEIAVIAGLSLLIVAWVRRGPGA